MEISNYVPGQAEPFFRNNLRDAIQDTRALDYVTSVMMAFLDKSRMDVLAGEKPYPVMVDELFRLQEKAKSYDGFRDIGDVCMWLSGFFPEHVSKTRKAGLGLAYCIERGRDAYNFAISVASSGRISGLPTASLGIVSDSFEGCARAILELKIKVNKVPELPPPDVVREIGDVMYGGRDITQYLASLAGGGRPALKVVE